MSNRNTMPDRAESRHWLPGMLNLAAMALLAVALYLGGVALWYINF